VLEILAQLLGITVGHDFREDFGGAILDGAHHAEQYATGDPAPGALLHPRLACAGLCTVALTLAQRPCGQTHPLGAAPPARSGQGKTPEDGCIFIQQHALPLARSLLQGGKCDRAIGEVGGSRRKPAGGATGAQRIFF
jgi:hypothetical protein